ncbi:YdcH family protein [Sphingomonas sp. DT-207]|uniref:YdcH family protein n=1 Tax=Sphingomonas sp. DT-207 TaxID=3396167 RepID=UPI003F19D285
MNAFIERLIAAHWMLNHEIRRELARRSPDPFRLSRLKKERLAVKDRLFHQIPDAAEMRRMARAVLRRGRPAQA